MSKWVLFFDLKTRESQEFFFKSLPFIMRLIVGKKRQEWQREIFLRISTHTHTPPRLLDDGIHIEITESSSRRSRRAPRQKNKRRTRDRRWTSSFFCLRVWVDLSPSSTRRARVLRREEALSFCARGIGIPKTFCFATNGGILRIRRTP